MVRARSNVWSHIVPGACFLLAAFRPALAATPNLVKNGSFEVNAPASGCASGTTTVFGWNVTAGNVDLDSEGCSTIPAEQGNIWVDLTGTVAGTISRNLLTAVGKNYSLSFYFGGNPQCQNGANGGEPTTIKSMNVLLNGVVVGTYSMDIAGAATDDPQWHEGIIVFTATTSPVLLGFQSLTSGTVCGPLLDNVRAVLIQ